MSVYLNEDGSFSGDVVLPTGPRRIHKDLRISQPDRFFVIPDDLMSQNEYLRATEHPGELVITLRDSDFTMSCSFFKSQLRSGSILLESIVELEATVARVTDPTYEPPPVTPEDAHAASVNGEFALHEAALATDVQLIDEIVSTHPERLQLENGNGWTPLEQAVWLGTATALERLIRHGADVNVHDGFGQTPLHIASNAGNLEKVTLLVNHGAEIDATKPDGSRPIHYAMMAGQDEVVEFLKRKGAQFDPKEKFSEDSLRISKDWNDEV